VKFDHYYNFTAESILKEFLKRLNIWQSYEENVDCASSALWVGHCPAKRWRNCLRSDVWLAETVVTASRYD